MVTEARRCIGVVLAGGRSRRMGRDKALLDWQGRSMLERQIALLHQAGVDAVKVSGERPEHAGVADMIPRAGPLAGLAAVAATVIGDADVLVIPVDMPLLQAALLRRLGRAQPEAHCLRFAGKVLPLRLHLDARSRGIITQLLRADDPGQRSLRTLQRQLGVREIPLSAAEAEQLIDCNSPETWREVKARP